VEKTEDKNFPTRKGKKVWKINRDETLARTTQYAHNTHMLARKALGIASFIIFINVNDPIIHMSLVEVALQSKDPALADSEMVRAIRAFERQELPVRREHCATHGHQPQWYQRSDGKKSFYEQACAYCFTPLRTAPIDDAGVQQMLRRSYV
jgi:hypothetical protein